MLSAVKKRLQAAQTKRVNKLANNVNAGRSISKARTANLLLLVMRYRPSNYHRNNKGRVVNKNGKKPVRKQILANIANHTNNLKNLNANSKKFIRNVESKANLKKYNSDFLTGFIVGHQQANYGPYYHLNNNNMTWLNNNGKVPNRKRLEYNARNRAHLILEEINLKKKVPF